MPESWFYLSYVIFINPKEHTAFAFVLSSDDCVDVSLESTFPGLLRGVTAVSDNLSRDQIQGQNP